ncbi:MAG: hypothetical protein IJ860_11430 [Eubacterium sp.]|nr:hypothetical protein [Eubacterium sp.]
MAQRGDGRLRNMRKHGAAQWLLPAGCMQTWRGAVTAACGTCANMARRGDGCLRNMRKHGAAQTALITE